MPSPHIRAVMRFVGLCVVLVIASAGPATPQQRVTVTLTGLVRAVPNDGAPAPWLGDATVALTAVGPDGTPVLPAADTVIVDTSTDATAHFAIYAQSRTPGTYALTATLEQNGGARTVPITIAASDDGRTIDTTIDVTPPSPSRGLPGPKTDPFVSVDVFFATDRKHGPSDDSIGASFLNEAATPRAMTYGKATVTIPRTHKRGELEGPDIREDGRDDKALHIILQRVDLVATADGLFHDITSNLAQAKHNPTRRILVYVHGYRNSFDHAARVAAQIKYDLEPVETTMVLFSWPSRDTILGYFDDQTQSDASVGEFKSFLLGLGRRIPGARISILAHSMGNSVVTEALRSIARDGVRKPVLDNLIMAAPDVPAAELSANSCAIAALSKSVTLYSSNHDQALLAAVAVSALQDVTNVRREDPLRAGFANPPLVALGVQTIDASTAVTDFLGHGYFAHDVDILSDIQGVLSGEPPPRSHLVSETRYWLYMAKPVGTSGAQRVDVPRCPADGKTSAL